MIKNPTILVVGGAGFIGSHINKMLHKAGYQTVVLDNLSRGYQEAVLYGTFVKGDLTDSEVLNHIFANYSIAAVMHFAAFIDVGESVKDPAKYYLNNVNATLNLLMAMLRYQVKTFVFSSTAAIFGHPVKPLIDEEHPCHPISPYGKTKWMIEKMLEDFEAAYGVRFCCLRYFNAAGGDPEGEIKNYQTRTSNLIPRILLSLDNPESFVTIYGTHYPTPDGTCIRDYIHIDDLGRAHLAALEKLLAGAPSNDYNLGSGTGFSVREIVHAIESILGVNVRVIEGKERAGDPAILLADSGKASRELNWHPRYSLRQIIEHARNAYPQFACY